MRENLRTLIQESFADCTTPREIAVLYAELRMEIELQMELMISEGEDS